MKFLTFEFKKILFSKKFILLMVLVIAGVSFLFLRNFSMDEHIQEQEKKVVQSRLKEGYKNTVVHTSILEENPDDEDEKKLQRINTSMVDTLYELRSLIGTDEWEQELQLTNRYLTEVMEYKEAGGENPLTETELRHELALNEKLIAEGMKPEHENYSLAMPNFTKQVVDLYINLGAIILMVMLIGEMLSAEYESNSINLLFTQPLKRAHIITSKFITSLFIYVVTTGVVLLSAMGIGRIFGDVGTFQYPIVIEKGNAIEFLTIADYIQQGLITVSVLIVFVVSLYFLYSLLFKHTLATIFVLLGSLAGGYVLTLLIPWNFFAWLNPFQYVMPEKIILLQNDQQWYQGIAVTLALGVVFFLVSQQKIKTSKID